MTVDICSIWAYEDIMKTKYLGQMQAKFLSVLSDAYPKALTAKEIVTEVEKKFGEKFSKYGLGSRITELTQKGFLVKYDQVVCPESGQKVNRWIYTGNRIPLPYKKEEVCCSKCKGTGIIIKKIYEKLQKDK